jgi:hypothetical protein
LKPSGLTIGQSFDGIDFLGSNCDCLPPDTNVAVGNGFVAEAVNTQFRVWNTSGTQLLDEPLSTLFGAPTGGDPYVVYDDTVNRWFINAFDSSDTGLFLAVSNDDSPLDGFVTYDLTNVGGFPDYAKPGYTKDAYFLSYNNFGTGGGNAEIATIDKTALLSGTLTYYISNPEPQFRAMPPAQLHGDTTGGTEWFVSTDGNDTGPLSTMRVTKMTNYLSNSPVFTYTSVPVSTYEGAGTANQPGGTITTFPNTTTYEVQYRNGHLDTAMATAQSKDGFAYPKGLIYQIDVSSGTPTLLRQVTIDPGLGVAVQMPSVDEDSNGNFGLTWMESSSTEYLSMWVDGLNKKTFKKPLTLATDVTPNAGFMTYNFRIGDYSTTVLDPADGLTFWSANEYVGPNGTTDIWSTHITSYTVPKK